MKSNDDIDIRMLLKHILKNKKTIFVISFLSFISGSLISFIPRSIWKGELQMINQLHFRKKDLAIPKIKKTSCIIELDDYTELDILKSETILKNIYEELKLNKTPKSNEFDKWVEQFNFDFKRGTRIISVTYKDQKKEDIIPILERVPIEYETYIKRKTNECLFNEKKILRKQLSKAENAFETSNKKLINFIKFNNLSFIKLAKSDQEDINMNLIIFSKSLNKNKIQQEILFKYEFLLEDYNNNKKQLHSLNTQYFNNEISYLDDRKFIEVLTKPRLGNNAIYPEKRKIAFLALLIGIIASLLFIVTKEDE